MEDTNYSSTVHSSAWHFQSILSFVLSFGSLLAGIAYFPADRWQRAFLAIAALYTVTSSISLTKTLRDEHEAKRFTSRVDTARVDRFIAQHDPLRAA